MKQPVSLVEYAVFHYPAGMEGWRCFRVEIGGHAESCIKECTIWLPPQFDYLTWEDLLNDCQKDEV